MGIFSPKDKSYLELYKKQATCIIESSKLLSLVSIDQSNRSDVTKKMHILEDTADLYKRDVTKWIHSTFVTPFDRDDMYRLTSYLDDVVDNFYQTIDMIELYQIDDLPKKAAKQISIISDLAILNFAIISGLTDIRAHEAELEQMREYVIDCEKAYRSQLSKVFDDKKIDPVNLLKIKGLTDSLNDIASAFKSVAYIVETISVKEG